MLNKIKSKLKHQKTLALLKKNGWLGNNTKITGKFEIRAPGGRIEIGQGSFIEGILTTERSSSHIKIHGNVYISGGTVLDCVKSITVEEDVLISYGCIIADSDNHSTKYSIRKLDIADWKKGQHNWDTHPHLPVVIKRGAWIGAHSIILKGVTIGEGSIVGAGSVVTRSVNPWTIVGGNPAREIRKIPESER